jgi:hypothetical protein
MKLFDSLVKFGKELAEIPRIGKYAAIVVILYFAFFVGSNKKETEFASFKAEYEQLLKEKDTLLKVSDSLETRVNDLRASVGTKDSTINKLTVTIERRVGQNRILVSELAELDAKMQDTVIRADTNTLLTLKDYAIANLKEQNANKDTIIVQKDSIITEQLQIIDTLNVALDISILRADTLETILKKLPTAPKDPNKLFWDIPKPSRKTVAVASFVGGVLATLFITK